MRFAQWGFGPAIALSSVKGGAILCHGAEQRRTTGRSVFSMSVTLRWASAEGLSGIERGAVQASVGLPAGRRTTPVLLCLRR